jgi:hypothetical protein
MKSRDKKIVTKSATRKELLKAAKSIVKAQWQNLTN